MPSLQSGLLVLSGVNAVFGAAVQRRGVTPALPYDEGTTSQCTWWHDQETDVSCDSILSENLIDLATFRRWNPSIGADCAGLTVGKSYCVEAAFEELPPTTPTPTGTPSATSSGAAPSTTAPLNGIETPLPTQPGMVSNCDAFYMVQSGDSCADIASSHGITLNQFLTWNPKAGSNCAGLWAETYACVSIIGHTPTTTSASAPSTTAPGNGVETPQPVQPSMVSNCDAFYFVKSGDLCQDIASAHGITLDQFTTWNPKAGSNCVGLWADTYACVSIIGHTPTTSTAKPSTTTPSNGISTPQPTQPNMVSNCDAFYLVKEGDECGTIASSSGITLAQFQTWNPKVGTTCSGLWANTYACVSIIGHTPSKPSTTTTTPSKTTSTGNGITTPTPTQSGMVKNCNKFHFVKTGQFCTDIQTLYKVTQAQLFKWNPAIKSDCSGMWANTYLCVGVKS